MLAERVVKRFLVRLAREFPSQDALNEYLREHPNALRPNHWVKGQKPSRPKEDANPAPTAPTQAVQSDKDLKYKIHRDQLKALSKVLGKDVTVHDLRRMNGHGNLPEGYGIDIRGISQSVYETDNRPDGLRVSADITHEGKKCGHLDRIYYREEGKLHVYHDEFFLDKAHQGSRVGKAVFNTQIDAYEKMGVDKVVLTAAQVGKYVWSKAGFEWKEPGQLSGCKAKLGKQLADKQGLPTDKVQGILDEIKTGEDIAHLEIDGKKVGKEFLVALTVFDLEEMTESGTGFIPMQQTPSKIKRL